MEENYSLEASRDQLKCDKYYFIRLTSIILLSNVKYIGTINLILILERQGDLNKYYY